MTAVIFNAEIGTSETSYACDCSTAYDDETAYLGELCEYPSTDFCTPPKSGKPLSSARFCVNHGTCSGGPSNDCECGDGFVGSSCERKIDLDNSDKDFDEEFGLCRDGLVCFNVSNVTLDHDIMLCNFCVLIQRLLFLLTNSNTGW